MKKFFATIFSVAMLLTASQLSPQDCKYANYSEKQEKVAKKNCARMTYALNCCIGFAANVGAHNKDFSTRIWLNAIGIIVGFCHHVWHNENYWPFGRTPHSASLGNSISGYFHGALYGAFAQSLYETAQPLTVRETRPEGINNVLDYSKEKWNKISTQTQQFFAKTQIR